MVSMYHLLLMIYPSPMSPGPVSREGAEKTLAQRRRHGPCTARPARRGEKGEDGGDFMGFFMGNILGGSSHLVSGL